MLGTGENAHSARPEQLLRRDGLVSATLRRRSRQGGKQRTLKSTRSCLSVGSSAPEEQHLGLRPRVGRVWKGTGGGGLGGLGGRPASGVPLRVRSLGRKPWRHLATRRSQKCRVSGPSQGSRTRISTLTRSADDPHVKPDEHRATPGPAGMGMAALSRGRARVRWGGRGWGRCRERAAWRQRGAGHQSARQVGVRRKNKQQENGAQSPGPSHRGEQRSCSSKGGPPLR